MFAMDLLCIRCVAGAPACPCLPGAQRLPQQALPPGSKDHMKRAPSLRQERPAGCETTQCLEQSCERKFKNLMDAMERNLLSRTVVQCDFRRPPPTLRIGPLA